LSGYQLAAWVYDVNTNGYAAYRGAGTDGGTFAIPGVLLGPNDPYFLEYNPVTWVEETAVANLDFSTYTDGRDDLVRAALPGTDVQLTVTGLQRWQATDVMQMTSGGANFTANIAYLASISPKFDAGEAKYVGQLNYTFFSRPRVEAGKGDTLVMYQLATENAGGNGIGLVRSAKNAFTTNSFTVADGLITMLDAGLTGTLPITTTQWTFDGPGFQQQAQAVNPVAIFQSASSGVSAVHGTRGRAGGVDQQFLLNPLLQFTNDPNAAASQTGHWVNPLPKWTTFGYAIASFGINYSIPNPAGGQDLTYPDSPAIADYDAIGPFLALGPKLEAQITPVRDIELDGQNAQANMTLARLTPTLSWTAPASGSPTFYRVLIQRITVVNGAPSASNTTLYLTDTSVHLFPGVLIGGGEHYVIRIGAWYQPARSMAAPFQGGFPEYYAEANTGLLLTP
jgi:hypothetical protein